MRSAGDIFNLSSQCQSAEKKIVSAERRRASCRFVQVRMPNTKTSPPPSYPHIVLVIRSLGWFTVNLFTPTEKICLLSSPEINDSVRQRTERGQIEKDIQRKREIWGERDCSTSSPKLIDSLLTGPSSIDRSVSSCRAVAYTEARTALLQWSTDTQ